MAEIEIINYFGTMVNHWDTFVDNSKNGTFMLKRGYIDYHADRFQDMSLMFYENDRLVALFPASLHNNEIRSHGGLTYGGIITDRKMTTTRMLRVMEALTDFYRKNGISRILYKRVPSIYYTYPSDEDLYALFRFNARLYRRDVSSTVYIPSRISFSELRRRSVKKAIKGDLHVRQSYDFDTYISLLTDVLKTHHNTKPVHTAQELKLLASRFPDAIKLYAAFHEDSMLAGVLIFDTPNVVHAQYIANSDKGRNIGALDLVIDFLINVYSENKLYFDFGISTENNGLYLNDGLIAQKEMFGGRAIAYDFYEIAL